MCFIMDLNLSCLDSRADTSQMIYISDEKLNELNSSNFIQYLIRARSFALLVVALAANHESFKRLTNLQEDMSVSSPYPVG